MTFLLKQNDFNDITLELNNGTTSNSIADENGLNIEKTNQNEIKVKRILNAIKNSMEINGIFDNYDLNVETEQPTINGELDDVKEDDSENSMAIRLPNNIEENHGLEHDEGVFNFACNCDGCINYRTTVIELLYEDFEFNTLWERLQLLIRKFYDIIPDDDGLMNQKYKSLMSKDLTKWLSDGRISNDKNIQISLGSNLPLSNEMTFILVFSMLYTRDPHQLFELLCIQLRSIAIAYSEGLKDLFKVDNGFTQYNPSDLLNFILDGYDKICKSAKALSPLLFELQRGHLQQFSLTWNLLNKRMYQRWVYLEVQKLIPECILKLKVLVYSEKYKSMVFRFIKFDDEMTLTTQMWRDVWSLMHDYNLSKKELERRKRIANVHAIFTKIKLSNLKLLLEEEENLQSVPQLIVMEKSDTNVWKSAYNFLKSKWIEAASDRLTIDITNMHCLICKFALASHYVDCKCRTCLIAGGPCFLNKNKEQSSELYCSKCSFYEKIDHEYINYITKNININLNFESLTNLDEILNDFDSTRIENVNKNNDMYHLSWAIFKHLPDRVPYVKKILNARNFCIFQNEPCNNIECRVATHIVAAIYPLSFSKLIIKSYQPVDYEKRKDILASNKLDIINLLNKLHDDMKKTVTRRDIGVNVSQFNERNILSTIYSYKNGSYLLKDMSSLFAEISLTDFKFTPDENIYPCFLSLFKGTEKDIELDLDRLDCIYASRLFLPTHHITKKVFGNDMTNEICDLKSQMNQLTISNSDTEDNNDLNETQTQTSSKRIDTNKDEDKKSKSSDNLLDEKLALPNEVFSEAMKFVVNKTINEELKAELKSLEKEHSVLKDMVRDLEQIKDYEEKLIHLKSTKTVTSSTVSPTTTTTTSKSTGILNNIIPECIPSDDCEPPSKENTTNKENNSTKTFHRSEGQCVCYYCTIFGQTECNRRIHGTRDRLRKRLNQIHSNKEANKPKNMKIKTADFLKTVNSKSVSIAKNVEDIKKSVNAVVDNSKNLQINQNKTLQSKLRNPNLVPREEIHKINQPKPITSTKSSNVNVSQIPANTITSNQIPTSIPINNPKSTPSEGTSSMGLSTLTELVQYIEGSSSSKLKDPAKKAAKKAKQKQKKEDMKKVYELIDLREEFINICQKEIDMRKDLKGLRSVKKKDKKKISEMEISVKELESEKLKKETIIKGIIKEIKKNRPDFEFLYESKKSDVSNPVTPVVKSNTTTTRIDSKNVHQFMPLIQASMQNSNSYDVSADPSKRMVTIRRVNLPHAEPQVTVTAKGPSPDKDMLLYTFVNGQLVPANSNQNNNTTQKQSMNQTQLPINKQTIQITKQNTSASSNKKTQNSCDIKLKPDEEVVAKSKTGQPETKKQKKKTESKIKQNQEKCEIEPAKDEKEKKLTKTEKKSKKKEKEKQVNDKPATKKDKKKVKNPTPEPEPEPPKEIIKKVTPVAYEYFDPSLKNNKFELLDEDLSDYEYIEEVVEEKIVAQPVKNESNTKQQNKKNKNKTNKNSDKNQNNKISDNINSQSNKSVNTKSESATNKSQQNPKTNDTQNKNVTPPINSKLSKKEKQKLKKLEKAKLNGNKTENVNNLTKSMQKMQLNNDTTIELVKRQNEKYLQNMTHNSNISIMEQLKRGVHVEGLKLPPGITLTRVDPETAEAAKAKKDSIAKISQPMSSVNEQQPIPPQLMLGNPIAPTASILPTLGLGPDPNGVIMIDTMNIKKTNNSQQQNKQQQQSQQKSTQSSKDGQQKKSKKNKKKNRNQTNSNETVKQNVNPINVDKKSNMVTLRNPMFHAVSNAIRTNQVGVPTMSGGVNGLDQPAAIIKNENGMFTIRNPALHQAMQSGVVNNFRQYSPTVCNPLSEQQENFSYFSDASSSHSNNKCYSAIGSEMKNAQQQKKIHGKQQNAMNCWGDNIPTNMPDVSQKIIHNGSGDLSGYNNNIQHFNNENTQQRQMPFDNHCVYGINNNFMAPQTSTTSIHHQNLPHGYYDTVTNNGNCYNAFQHPNDCGGLFNNRCSDTNSSASSTPSTTQHSYYDGCSGSHNQNKYDDTAFLQSLQPGHRLNSEVTIHNISESKFLRAQQMQQLPNGVEITKIHGPSMKPNLAVGSNRTSKSFNNGGQNYGKQDMHLLNEYGDQIFAPNQSVNLNELESEERDIETFKRFNYYFEPPKTKPKINLNVKDIVVNKKLTSNNIENDQQNHQIHNQNAIPGGSSIQIPSLSSTPDFSFPSEQENYNYQNFIDYLKSNNLRNGLNYGTIGSEMKYKYDHLIE